MLGSELVVLRHDFAENFERIKKIRFGFESRPGASPQGGLRGGRSLCEYCTNKLTKLGPDWPKVKKKLTLLFKYVTHLDKLNSEEAFC